MSTIPAVLADATALLQAHGDEPTPDLRSRLASWAAKRAVQARLLADVEPYDGSTTHHVLVSEPDGRTWSIGLAAPTELPWPLRGVTRSSENQLLRVDDRVMEVWEAVACLDFVWSDQALADRLVDSCIVQSEIERRGIELDAAELQRATDSFRRAKGLLSAERTSQWLSEHGLARAALVELARGSALVARLRAEIVAAVPEQTLADLAERLTEIDVAWSDGPPDALAADPVAAVAAACRAGRHAGVARWRVEELAPVFAVLAGAAAGKVLPVGTEGLHAVVLARHAAAPGAQTGSRLERLVFEEWLATRRAQADVEWLWGANAVVQPPSVQPPSVQPPSVQPPSRDASSLQASPSKLDASREGGWGRQAGGARQAGGGRQAGG